MTHSPQIKIIFALTLVLALGGFAHALDYRPATIKAMDVTVTNEARGAFYGTVSAGDRMELLALSLRSLPDQELVSLDEYMEIGGAKILPVHVERNGLYYSKYNIDDLYEFADTPEFRIVREARLRKTAKIGLGEDYNLSAAIMDINNFLGQTDYIEVNDQSLRSKANLEFLSDSEIGTIRQVAEWVNSNIKYDFENYYGTIYSARQTYDAGAGVCDEFANLTAAFLRIKGVPARYVSGISFDGERFGNHGWLEVFLPGTGWIGVDSTYGEAGYIDAGHFIVARTADANEAVDFVFLTTSRKPIQVETRLGLPQVKVNSVGFFEGLTQAELPTLAVHSEEAFTISAKVKNVSGSDAIFPVELAIHKDFMVVQPQKLVYLLDGEEQTLSWSVKATEKEIEGGYYKYEVALLLPDGNVTGWVTMNPGRPEQEERTEIVVKDMSPRVFGDEIAITLTLQNRGGKAGSVGISVAFEGSQVAEQDVEVGEFGEKVVVQRISGIRPGTLTLEVATGDKKKSYAISIPEHIKEETHLAVEVVPQPENPPEDEVAPGKATRFLQGVDPATIIIVVVASVVMVVAVIGILALMLLHG